MEGERIEHPAFGMVSLGRVNGHTRLHNSDINHLNWISLKVSTATKKRGLHSDWHHANRTLIEVWLSPVQLSEALFNMNTSGVPCTLHRYFDTDGSMVEPDLNTMPRNDVLDQFTEESSEMLEETVGLVQEVSAKLDSICESKGVRKSEIKALKKMLDKAKQHLVSNLSFVEKQFNKAMERKVMQGKAELEAYVENKLRSIGLEAAQKDAKKMFGEPEGEQKKLSGKSKK